LHSWQASVIFGRTSVAATVECLSHIVAGLTAGSFKLGLSRIPVTVLAAVPAATAFRMTLTV